MSTPMKRLFLIDVSGFLYRSYFAIQGFSNKSGDATNALFGFIRSYFKLIETCKPDHVVAIFDAERSKESRLKIYPEYKAHREATPSDLISQIIEAQKFCTLMGIPILAIPGVEADDTIASVVTWGKQHAEEIFVVSQDKDLMQLVDETVKMINPAKDFAVVDRAGVEAHFNIPPEHIIDYLAICGDASDNVPGISGFGPKSAVDLLKRFGSLDAILDHADEIGGKKGATLKAERQIALLSRKLVELDHEVEIPQDKDFYLFKPPQWDKVKELFVEKNFKSLLKIIPEPQAPDLFSSLKRECNYVIVQDEKALQSLVERALQQKELCIDTETTSEFAMRAELVGIGLGIDEKEAFYIPLNGTIPRERVIEMFLPLFTAPHVHFYGHNIKYDIHVLRNAGLKIERLSFDTMLASYLLNAHERRHSLDELTLEYFGHTKIPTSEIIGSGKSQTTMDKVAITKVGEYCCEDIEYTYRLKQRLSKELTGRGLEHLLYELELPLTLVLAEMEAKGMFVDVECLSKLSTVMAHEIAMLEKSIFDLAGESFNLNSPKQLGQILYEKLLIPITKRGKTGPSTSAEVLETLAVSYPIAEKILEYRSVEKLRSTYVDALPSEVNPHTQRIHCNFNQSVAATGRLSCQNPNLQNIPVRTELGRKIREAFRPQKPGWSFIACDYSQIELRLLAHVAEDEGLIHAFLHDLDVHAYTASQIFQVSLEEVTPEMRHRAKAVNFGIIYGQQAFGLSQELRITFKEAAHFIETYYARYPRVQGYIEHMKQVAKATGRAVTLTGRERLIPEINSSNQMLRSQAERLAVNTPLQGTAADLIKIAMLRIDSWMKKEKPRAYPILQIHDELIFEVPDEEIPLMTDAIKQHMEQVMELKVPLIVQIAVGKNWKEC